ncbi:Ubiquitin-conjugating enzyme E2 J1 [Mortierella sp. AM989]|nr:Ubiquitin-conjugating enzyme E2 J1 [Mortierella sp. AM989]
MAKPNGRFELHKKVCLSITGYHPEYWQPAWGIRTVLVAVMGFLPTQSKGAIGGLDTSVEARKALATKSKTWMCSTCRTDNISILPDVAPEDVVKASLKADEMPPEFSFGYEADKKKLQSTEDSGKDSGKDNRLGGSESTSENNQGLLSTALASTGSTVSKEDDSSLGAAGSKATDTEAQNPSSSPVPVTTSYQHPNSLKSGSTSTTTLSNTPQDTPRTTHNASITTSSTTELRSRTTVQQPQQPQHQTQSQARTVTRRAESSIPIWLDALILGFGGILVAMVIRRFM